jgi:hypothetical protein
MATLSGSSIPRKPKKSLMQFVAEGAGYCCVVEMLKANYKKSGRELAKKLGVEATEINRYRRRMRLGYLHPCPKCPPKDFRGTGL